MNNTELYEYDFNAWIIQQIDLLKAGKTNEIDAVINPNLGILA